MKPVYHKITAQDIDYFSSIVGSGYVFTDTVTLQDYGHDWTEDFLFPPEVVLKPATVQEISAIMAYCHQAYIPVTPIGGRTGLSGGMLSVYGGVGLSLERMNRILDIDTRNMQVTVQPGVITQVLQEAVSGHNLMYPPDPSSRGSCFIGGNIAENAGGIHAVKYGITREYVLALEAVLPDGKIIRTGAKVLKNSTGYNLTQLLIGSEGTLGVVTEIVLKLLPAPKYDRVLLIPFEKAADACDAVAAIFNAGILPSALEFIEKDAIDFGQAFLGIQTYRTDNLEALLLVEVDGNDTDKLWEEIQEILTVLEFFNIGEILFAESADQKEELWRLRRSLGEAVKGNTIYKEVDTVVPRGTLAQLLAEVKKICLAYGLFSVCYGHAGDGNLHVNIIKQGVTEEQWKIEVPKAIREIFKCVQQLGGTLSGEHGVGYVLPQYLDIVFSPAELALMHGIKQVFDPHMILNPGKIFKVPTDTPVR